MVDITVVLPVFRNESELRPLHAELARVLDGLGLSHELVFVDDASPDGSAGVLASLSAEDTTVRVVTLPDNVGQHRAVLEGLRVARGSVVVTMDADGQDPPEAIPALLDRLGHGVHAVFAGRRGSYESRGRLLTSRLFKRMLHHAAGVPSDAGMYAVMDRTMVDAVLALPDPPPFVVALLGLTRLPVTSIPVERRPRERGRSAYGPLGRLSIGVGTIAGVLAWRVRHPRRKAARRAEHNLAQRRYYETSEHPNIRPRESRYLRRQIAVAIEAAGITPRDRILEIGCGMGRYTLLMADDLPRLEALDLSPVLLERMVDADGGRRRFPTHAADIADPPEGLLGAFDVVCGYFVLHHLHDLPASFEAMARLLKPGGRLVFVEPNPLNVLYYVQMLVTPGMSFRGDSGMLRMRPRVVSRAMADAGLSPAGWKRFGFFPPFVADTAAGARLERSLEAFPLWRPLLPFHVFTAEIP